MKPISLQLYTLRELAKQDFIGVLKKVAAIGYLGVEPAGLFGHKPSEIKAIVADLGMAVSSNHQPWPSRDNLAEVHFENVFVPDDGVLGEPGGGFPVLGSALDMGRYSVAARCIGQAQRCIDRSEKPGPIPFGSRHGLRRRPHVVLQHTLGGFERYGAGQRAVDGGGERVDVGPRPL